MLIEITTFSLADGTDEEGFLAADKAVQEEFFHQQVGLVRRTTARGHDGGWCVITLWGGTEFADSAAEAAKGDPAVQAFRQAIDESSLETRRYEDLG